MKKSVTGLDKEGKKNFRRFNISTTSLSLSFSSLSLPIFLLSLSPYLSLLSPPLILLSLSPLSLSISLLYDNSLSLPLSFSLSLFPLFNPLVHTIPLQDYICVRD
jgi:hypothetical protein